MYDMTTLGKKAGKDVNDTENKMIQLTNVIKREDLRRGGCSTCPCSLW